MIESILKEVRDNIIHDDECTDFDNELIPLINSYLMTLNQNGIGVVGYRVTGEDQTWAEFLEGNKILEATIEYVNLTPLQVLQFLPPFRPFRQNTCGVCDTRQRKECNQNGKQ